MVVALPAPLQLVSVLAVMLTFGRRLTVESGQLIECTLPNKDCSMAMQLIHSVCISDQVQPSTLHRCIYRTCLLGVSIGGACGVSCG